MPNAVVDPDAVVVHLEDTAVALVAVVDAREEVGAVGPAFAAVWGFVSRSLWYESRVPIHRRNV